MMVHFMKMMTNKAPKESEKMKMVSLKMEIKVTVVNKKNSETTT